MKEKELPQKLIQDDRESTSDQDDRESTSDKDDWKSTPYQEDLKSTLYQDDWKSTPYQEGLKSTPDQDGLKSIPYQDNRKSIEENQKVANRWISQVEQHPLGLIGDKNLIQMLNQNNGANISKKNQAHITMSRHRQFELALSAKRVITERFFMEPQILGVGIQFEHFGHHDYGDISTSFAYADRRNNQGIVVYIDIGQTSAVKDIPEFIGDVPVIKVFMPPFVAMTGNQGITTSGRENVSPLIGGMGCGINLDGGNINGTIGCFCRSLNEQDLAADPDAVYLLSNNHVLAGVNRAKVGNPIYRTGLIDNSIATLHRFNEIKFGGENNPVDAAIARLNDGVAYRSKIENIGNILGTTTVNDNGMVRKYGASSGYTEGIIDAIALDFKVGMGGGKIADFNNQLSIKSTTGQIFCRPGDSGSLVVDQESQQAVGLFFAGNAYGFGIATPIDVVLKELEIELL